VPTVRVAAVGYVPAKADMQLVDVPGTG